MPSRRRTVVLALVCVLAVSLAAATLPAPTDPTGDGAGAGDEARQVGSGAHETESRSNGLIRNAEGTSGSPVPPLSGFCVPFLTSPAFFGLVALGAAGGAFAINRRLGRTPAVVVVAGGALSAVPLWLMATDCRSSVAVADSGVEELAFAPGEVGDAGGGEAAAQAATTLVTEPLLVVAVAVVVASLVGIAYYASAGNETAPDADAASDDGEDAVDAGVNADASVVGTAAGEAADRIEAGADVDNEVYRAWRDLADRTGLPGSASATPREFAVAAREQGVPEDAVTTLTELFRAVRYGDAVATADREERAVAALRSIQAAATERDDDAASGEDDGTE